MTNPSSTTAEALAMQQAILHAPAKFKLQLHSDSTSAISSLTQIITQSQSLTSRQKLKIPNLLIYEIISHSLQQNQQSLTLTHVKAHTNQQGEHFIYNKIADTLAKQAANPVDKEGTLNAIYYRQFSPYIPKELASNYQHTQVFYNGMIAMTYPRKLIKKHFITQHNDIITSKIQDAYHSIYPHLPPLSAESTKQALKMASNLSKMSHFLDARNVHEEKFRRNLLLNQIPTLVLMKSWKLKSGFPTSSNCVMCSCNTPEDFHHLWTCANISKQVEKMIPTVLIIIKERYNIPANTLALQLLIKRLQLSKYTSLPTIIKLSFFPELEINTLQTFIQKSHKGKPADILNLIFQLLDSYLSAFYELIWKPRCRTIHSGKDPPFSDPEYPSAGTPFSPLTNSLPPSTESSAQNSSTKRPRTQEETQGSSKRYNLRSSNPKSQATPSIHLDYSEPEWPPPNLSTKHKRKAGIIYSSDDSDYSNCESVPPASKASTSTGNNNTTSTNISSTPYTYPSPLNKRARLSIQPPQYTQNYWTFLDGGEG
jgi:ribonuclease HI